MAGESPLNMMRTVPRSSAKRPHARRRRRLWPFLAPVAGVIVIALGWCWLWYYAATVSEHTLAGWIEREAALGRVYACGQQGVSGFPFGILSRCTQAAASFNSMQPPFAVTAREIAFSAQLLRPTTLNGAIGGPVTLANPGQPPIFVADWSEARLSLSGLPAEPERVAVALIKPRLDRVAGAGSGMIFAAEAVDVDGRIVAGSARSNPVIEVTGHFAGAIAPSFHPLLGAPVRADIDAMLRGFKDFAPKPWPVAFREMQASGGGIDIKSLRLERTDAVVVASGALTVNGGGRLDGELQIAVAGIETIVPLLGIDQLIGQGIDRLTGGGGVPAQGFRALDRLLPGLGGAVRAGTSVGLIDSIKKMGQPTTIDGKPAVALPLRIGDGVVYLGLIPLGVLPAVF